MALTTRVATLQGLLPLEALQTVMHYDSHPAADLIRDHFLDMALEELEEELEEAWADTVDPETEVDTLTAWDNVDAIAAKIVSLPKSAHAKDILENILREYVYLNEFYERQPPPEILAYLTAMDPFFPEIYRSMLLRPDLF